MDTPRTLIVLLAFAALVGVSSCGSASSSDKAASDPADQVGQASQTDIPSDAKKGGDLTILSGGDIDWVDPGQTYYQFGFQVQYAVNRPLYSFKPDDAAKPVPDLADGDPQVSSDQKTITVKLRSGVKYAPPVNREVRAADVKYAIERAFTSNVPSGYASTYFSDIEGAPAEPVKMADLKPFSGLQTPDDRTLVINLTKPVAGLVTSALVMPITVPVPREYAAKFDQKSPTDYDQYTAFTGPYIVRNDPETGELTGRQPGKQVELVRNPNWDPSTDYRPAYLDSITIEEGNNDTALASRRTLAGEATVCCGDAAHPPASILARALTQNEDQVGRANGGGAHWDAFNTTIKPFDNVNVRRAAIAITDRYAIRKVAGGAALGPIAQGYIPPGIPGFEESGGIDGFDEFDWMTHPDGGDATVARKYMALAAEDGVPISDGKYAGDAKLVGVVASNPTSLQGAESLAADLKKIGLDINVRQVPQDTLYTKFCGVPKQEPAMCIGVGWVKDFQDAQTLLAPIFPSDTIRPSGNVNWSQLSDPEIDAAVANASKTAAGPDRDQAFADANRLIVAEAPAVPTTWDDNIQLQSKDVEGVMNIYNASWDLAYTSLK